MKMTTKLRHLAERREALIIPGAPNALFARAAEDAGFEAVYVTGAGIANMLLGAPDIGLTTMSEVSDTVWRITDAVDVPLLVDADTGFGNPLNMIRTVRSFERAGASAIQIEDQVFPKKCGHFEGKAVVGLPEMLDKIRAAVDTRRDPDLQIIARTDARAIDGFSAAMDRAHAFVETGADIIFVEAPVSEEEMSAIARDIEVPNVANIVYGGKTPEVGQKRLREMGFSFVLYANATLQAALCASNEVLRALKEDGGLTRVRDRLATFEQRQAAVAKHDWDAKDRRYARN